MESCSNVIFDVFRIDYPRISKILNGLYLGDEEASKDLKLLEEHKIKRIVQVRFLNF